MWARRTACRHKRRLQLGAAFRTPPRAGQEPVLGLAEAEVWEELVFHHLIAIFECRLHLGAKEGFATRAVPASERARLSTLEHLPVQEQAGSLHDNIDAMV